MNNLKSRSAIPTSLNRKSLDALPLDKLESQLPKTTFYRLTSIAKHIRIILFTRAACLSWLVLFGTTLVGMAIDANFLLSLQTRSLIAAVIFISTCATFAWTLIPKLKQLASPRWLALAIESAVPSLKNRLLSALDLASAPIAIQTQGPHASTMQKKSLGSADFIDAFQLQVAGKMETVAPHHVLHWNTIRRWMIAACMSLCAFMLCFVFPGLSFAKRVGRVWFPTLNIGRIAAYELTIIPPNQPWIEVRNDLFEVQARALVGLPPSVTLEVQSEDGNLRSLDMQATADDPARFTQNLALDGKLARLRVVALDSMSGWYDIELVDRPVVMPASVTLRYPSYAKVPDLQINDWNGSLDCVLGTQVEAIFQSDTLLKSSELLFEPERRISRSNDGSANLDVPNSISMQVKSDQRQVADFTVRNSGRYSIKAIDDRTHKVSDLTRSYAVIGREDLPPTLAWQIPAPTRAKFIAANELVALRIAISDEFPLESIQAEYSIDQSDWKKVELTTPESNREILEWPFDPLSMGLRDSQLIEIRFVATDRKKQQTISEPTQWLVNDSYTSDARWKSIDSRFQLVAPLRNLANRWTEWMKQSDEIWQKSPEQVLSHLRQMPGETETLQEVRATLQTLITQSEDLVEQDALIDLSLFLKRLLDQEIARLKLQVLRLEDNTPREELGQVRNEAREVVRAFESVQKSAYQLLGEDLMLAANQDMYSILDAQKTLLDSLTKIPSAQIRDRQAAIGGVLENLIERLLKYSKAFPENEQASFTLQLRNLRQTQASIASITGKNLLQKNSYWTTDESRRWIEQTLQQLDQYHRMHTLLDGYFSQHRDNRRSIAPAYAIWSDPLAKLQQKLHQIASKDNLANKLTLVVDAQKATKAILDLIAETRTLETSRLNIDRYYVADVGNIRRALANISQESFGTEEVQSVAINEVLPASRVLATAHRMKLALDVEKHLLSIESDIKSLDPTLRAEQPRNVSDATFHIDYARDQAHELQLLDSINQAWQHVSWSPTVQVVNDSMNNRRWSRDPIQRVSAGQREIVDTMEQARLEMEPRIAEARAVIAKYVPKVSELAETASAKVEETKQAITSPTAEKDSPAQETKQTEATQAVEAVKQSLQDLAAVQDLLTEEQAQIARDADQALQAIESAANKASQAMEKAKATSPQDSQATNQAKESSLKAQNTLQEVLDQVGQHFAQVEQGKTPSQPLDLANEPDKPNTAPNQPLEANETSTDNDEAYQEAEFLRELAAMTPDAILKQLEKELPSRETMQNSLEEINSQGLEQTAATLQSVATKQRELTRELEMSDPLTQAQLQNSVEQMHQVSRFLRKLNDQQVNWALQTTGRSQLPQVQEKMNAARNKLNQLADRFAAANAETTMAELNEKVQELREASESLKEEFSSLAQDTSQEELKPISTDERQLKNLEREAKDWQTRYRRENEN